MAKRSDQTKAAPLRDIAAPPPLPTVDGGWKTVLADPPWRFTNRTGKVAPEHRRLDRYSTLDLDAICTMEAVAATRKLTAIKGIGRWTAEIFLLFCARNADVLPAGDLALQVAAAEALALDKRPSEKELRAISELWSPWRGVAAKLLWAYYKTMRQGRNVLPV